MNQEEDQEDPGMKLLICRNWVGRDEQKGGDWPNLAYSLKEGLVGKSQKVPNDLWLKEAYYFKRDHFMTFVFLRNKMGRAIR